MLNTLELINQRQRQILVHSCIYYQLNENIISDYTFDRWSKELVQLQQNFPDVAKQSDYHLDFLSFEGESGFHLPYHHPCIQGLALWLIQYHNKQALN